MSKEATIIQTYNNEKRIHEYSVKGYDVTESVKILLKRHKEEYDKEKKIFAGIDGYLEAQKEYQSQIADLEAKLAEHEKHNAWVQEFLEKYQINTELTPEYSENPIIEYCEQVEDFRAVDKKIIVNLTNLCDEWADKYLALKSELAEKDRQLKVMRELKNRHYNYYKTCETEYSQLNHQLAKKEKDKILFAVEKLEKVKEKLKGYEKIYIDNQIKQLKEGK